MAPPTSVTTRWVLKPPESASACRKISLILLSSAPCSAVSAGGSLIGSKATSDDLHPSFSPIWNQVR